MSDFSRRKFMATAGGGSLAVGVGASLAASQTADRGADAAARSFNDVTRVVAFVSDPEGGEVTLMADDHERVVVDHALAAALSSAAKAQSGVSV